MRAVTAALVLFGAATLAGCSSHTVIDSLPATIGGLPENAPERPAGPPTYPAVHDMPPGRADTPLTAEEKKKLRDELAATRDRAARRAATNPDRATVTGSTPDTGASVNP